MSHKAIPYAFPGEWGLKSMPMPLVTNMSGAWYLDLQHTSAKSPYYLKNTENLYIIDALA